MRIVPSLVVVLGLWVSAAAQEMQEKQEKHAKKVQHEPKRDDAGHEEEAKVAKARWCEECKAFLDPKTLVEKHRCPRCNQTARRVETTTVKTYACEHCGRRSECPRECCGEPVKESSLRAAVLFKCETCGAIDTRGGPCPAPGCRKSGRALVRTVELPHEDHAEK